MSYNKSTIAGNLHTVSVNALVEAKTADYTVLESDNKKVFTSATDNINFTLPATQNGLEYTFINTAAAGNCKLIITPNASDMIVGTFTLAASIVKLTGADGTAIYNTKASQTKGNYVKLVANGTTGWVIQNSAGIWRLT